MVPVEALPIAKNTLHSAEKTDEGKVGQHLHSLQWVLLKNSFTN